MNQRSNVSRRGALRVLAAAGVGGVFVPTTGCSRKAGPRVVRTLKPVVAYCSADAVYARPVFARFTERTGVPVDAVFDTEATKTTGLVQRLLTEKRSPRADIWWSSEPFGTIRLAREGVLGAWTCEEAERSVPGGWPTELKGSTWYGFSSRARVFVVNQERVEEAAHPRTLEDLLAERFKGRVALARPQFGTTRGHMAAIATVYGEDGLRDWLARLKQHGVRLYDGNAAVARAVATGECHVGLTDSDDVYAGQREGWPIELVYERNDLAGRGPQSELPTMGRGMGPMLVPNTVGLVSGGPNAAGGENLAAFLLSAEAQRTLAESDSRNTPVQPDLAREFAAYAAPNPARLRLEEVESRVESAMRIVGDTLGGV